MIDVYIRFYKDQDSGSKIEPIAAEKKILTLPTTMQLNGLPIQNPKVKVEMGKSESFDFTLTKNSPYYQGVFQNKTIFRVVYDGNTIFYGRAITIDTNWKNGNQTVHCEGPLSFLVDTYYKAVKETNRKKVSLNTYITDLLSNHRWYVGDHSRDIWPGEIPGGYSNAIESDQQISNVSEKFGVSSWTETKSALEDVRGYYGGYFRTRYSGENGAGYGYVYLDWLKDYYRDMTGPNVQKIEVAKNLIDYSARTEISNLFTAIVPVGKDGLTLGGYNGSNLSTEVWKDVNQDSNGTADWISVRAVYEMYHDALNQGYHNAEDYHTALNIYGWVYKTVSFPDAGTKSKLFTEAIDWLKNNYYPFVDTYTIKAIDMRMLGKADDAILVGDKRVFSYISSDGASGSATKPMTLTVISAEYDLYNLENTSYKVGIPSELLTKMWNVKSGTKTTGNSTDPKGNPGGNEQTASEEYDDWMARVKRFLMLHDVPGSDPAKCYYIPGVGGMFGQLYNSLTGQWDYLDDHDGLTYEEVRSRGLVSWIPLHDEPEDAAEWKRIIYGYNDDNKTPYLDMLRETFKSKNVPGSSPAKAILSEDESEIYNPVIGQWVHINEFSLALVESLGLYEWYYNNFGVDLRDESAVYTVTDTEIDPETGKAKAKTTSVFGWMYDKVDNAFKKAKLFMYNWTNNTWEFIDQLNGTSQAYVDSYSTEWVNTKDSIGQIIKRKRTDEQGNVIYDVDAAKILASVRNNPDTGVEETLAEVMADTVDVRATNKITLALNGVDASFILSKFDNDGKKASLAQLVADYIQITGKNINITASEYANLGIVTTNNAGDTITAQFIVDTIEDATTGEKESLAQVIADNIQITGKNVNISASEYADLGIVTTDNAGNTITAKFITDAINGGTATIDAKNLNLTNTEVINLINETGSVKISAAKINLDGYLTATGVSAGTQTVSHFHCTGTVQADSSVIAGDYIYGNQESLLDAFISVTKTESGNDITLTFHRAQSRSQDQSVTFSKAGSVTISGAWGTGADIGKFTVGPTISGTSNTVYTIIQQGSGHWGDPNNDEDENTYYGVITATLNGGNYAYTAQSIIVSGLARYNAGKTYATDNLSVVDNGNNKVDVTLDGTTVTTYSHNKYTLGQNSIRIAKSWSGGIATFTKSTASTLPTSQEVRLTSATTWNGNVATVAIWDGPAADAQQGGVSTEYTVTVNAQSIYNAGFDAVKLSDSWSSPTSASSTTNTLTVSVDDKTDGTERKKQYVVSIGVGTWQSGQIELRAYAGGVVRVARNLSLPSSAAITGSYQSSTVAYAITATIGGKDYTGNIDAGDAYNDGFDDVTFTGVSWGTATQSGSAVYVDATTSINPKKVGTNTARTNTTRLYLVRGSWTSGSLPVYLRSAAANGTERASISVPMPSSADIAGSYNASTDKYDITVTAGGKEYTGAINPTRPIQPQDITASTLTAVTTTTGLTNLGTVAAVIDGSTKTAKYATTISSVKGFYLTVDGTDAYAAGWNAAVSGTSMPSSYSTSTTINVRLPSTTVDGELRTRQYVIGADATYAYLQYVRSSDSQYVTVCRVTHNQYNLGWHAAYDVNGLPSAYATNSYMTVTMPGSSPGNTITRKYYVGADSNYAYIQYLRESDNQYVTVARIPNTGGGSGSTYNSGWIAAYNQITLPTTASTANSYIDIITPKSTPGSYPPATSRYTLSADTSYVYLKYGTVTVARADNTGYQSAYEAGFQEGWTRCLNPYYSYWWAGTETIDGVNWWDVCRPKTTAWRYALQGESAYQAALQDDWKNVGEYWDDACYSIGGTETHAVAASNLNRQAASQGDSFISGCRQLTHTWTISSTPMYYKFKVTCGSSSAWYYFKI